MKTVANGYYRSGNKLVRVRDGAVTALHDVRGTDAESVFSLNPSDWADCDPEDYDEYKSEMEAATEQLSNPFTELEYLGDTYDEALEEWFA